MRDQHDAPISTLAATILAVATIAGVGASICIAVDRVVRRLDRLETNLDEQREQGYAEGYVAATAGRTHLTAVPQR